MEWNWVILSLVRGVLSDSQSVKEAYEANAHYRKLVLKWAVGSSQCHRTAIALNFLRNHILNTRNICLISFHDQ